MALTLTHRHSKTFETETSKVVAAGNPNIFEFSRQDYAITEVRSTGVYAQPTLIGTDITSLLTTGDPIYFTDSDGGHIANITSFTYAGGETLIITDYAKTGGIDSGSYYINLLGTYENYRLDVDITTTDGDLVQTTNNFPDQSGALKFNASPALKHLFEKENLNPFTGVNKRDTNYFRTFTLTYTIKYGNTTGATTTSAEYFTTYSALQIGSTYGQNMAEYCGFNADLTVKGKFLSVFESPMYWPGYPWDISSILPDNGGAATYYRTASYYNSEEATGTATAGATDALTDVGVAGLHRINFPADDLTSLHSSISMYLDTDGVIPVNTAPVASALTLTTSPLAESTTATWTFTLIDSDGDPLVLTNSTRIYTATDTLGTGKTLVSTVTPTLVSGSSYTFDYSVLLAEVGLYYIIEIDPATSSGVSPGTMLTDAFGPVVENVVKVAEIRTTKTTAFQASWTYANGESYEIRAFDEYTDTAYVSTPQTGTDALQVTAITFTGGTSHKVEIWGKVDRLYGLSCSSQNVTYIDLGSCTNFGIDATNGGLYSISNDLDTLILPSDVAKIACLQVGNSTSVTAIDISGWRGLAGSVKITNNSAMTTISFPTSTTVSGAEVTGLDMIGMASYTSSGLAFAGLNFAASYRFNVILSTNITGVITWPTNMLDNVANFFTLATLGVTAAGLDKIKLGGTVYIAGLSSVTDWGSAGGGTFAIPSSTASIPSMTWFGSGTNTQAVDMSGLTNNSGYLYINNFSGGVLWPTGNSNSFTYMRAYNLGNTTRPLLSGFTNLMGTNSMQLFMQVMASLSTTELNQMIVDVDGVTSSGPTGRTFNTVGSGVPTSGPPDAEAAVINLSADGVTVTTD